SVCDYRRCHTSTARFEWDRCADAFPDRLCIWSLRWTSTSGDGLRHGNGGWCLGCDHNRPRGIRHFIPQNSILLLPLRSPGMFSIMICRKMKASGVLLGEVRLPFERSIRIGLTWFSETELRASGWPALKTHLAGTHTGRNCVH